MRFTETTVPGAFVLGLERHTDERGFFARTFCRRELAERGLNPNVEQCSVSFNPRAGTLRGMHYQAAPHQEAKLVRCVAGVIYDVVVDLRPESSAYLTWFAITLDAVARDAVYVPEGCAHGFLTLTPDAEVLYQMSAAFVPAAARGVRWDDPSLAIEWPAVPSIIAAHDREYPLL